MDEGKIKMAIIAGASKAIKLRDKNPRADEMEILKMISREIDEMIKKIDNDK